MVTSLATSSLRTELESLSFLFMPQSNSLLLAKAAAEEAASELDKILASIVMGIQVILMYVLASIYMVFAREKSLMVNLGLKSQEFSMGFCG